MASTLDLLLDLWRGTHSTERWWRQHTDVMTDDPRPRIQEILPFKTNVFISREEANKTNDTFSVAVEIQILRAADLSAALTDAGGTTNDPSSSYAQKLCIVLHWRMWCHSFEFFFSFDSVLHCDSVRHSTVHRLLNRRLFFPPTK